MTHSFDELADYQRRCWVKPNAHLWMRPDAQRFMRLDAARSMPNADHWRHPDEKLWNFVAAHHVRTIAMYARGTGANLSIAPELARLQAEQDAIQRDFVELKQQRQRERALERAEAERLKNRYDAAWDKFIAAFNQHWDACRKAGFNPAQPRVPAGNPDGGQWTSGVPAAALTIPASYRTQRQTMNGSPARDMPSVGAGAVLASAGSLQVKRLDFRP